MGKIIAFAGRIGSGKSELAEICQKYGYEKIYFAYPLKKLVSELIHVDISEINGLKNVEKDYHFLKMDYMFIALQTGIPYKTVLDEMSKVKFKTVRQLLQFIGTDLIRKYNTNWHVNKIRAMINKDKDYVIDDVRFKNEFDLIRELGGDCWFIVRPKIDNVSNHESEVTLRWQDFGNKVIINDASLRMFRFKWEAFFKYYDKSVITRDGYMKSTCVSELLSEISEPLSTYDILEISNSWFTYKERKFDCNNIKDVTQNEDMSVEIKYADDTSEIVKNPLNIEDLKFCL